MCSKSFFIQVNDRHVVPSSTLRVVSRISVQALISVQARISVQGGILTKKTNKRTGWNFDQNNRL